MESAPAEPTDQTNSVLRDPAKYLARVKEIISQVESRRLDLQDAASIIEGLHTGGPIHPMLREVGCIAWDIREDLHSDEEIKRAREDIKRCIEKYESFDWPSTCWVLIGMYRLYTSRGFEQSFSVKVVRSEGKTDIKTGNENLQVAIGDISDKLNHRQTDEWYLYNLKERLPREVGDLRLMNVEVEESLEPIR